MPRPKKHIHYVYKTTNLINGRYYIGKRSAYFLEDGYMGSGKRLRYEIDKYGRENFKKEILEFFDTSELALEREKQIVNEEILKDPLCLNLQIGGNGGGGYRSEEHKKLWLNSQRENGRKGGKATAKTRNFGRFIQDKINADPEYAKRYHKPRSSESKHKMHLAQENRTWIRKDGEEKKKHVKNDVLKSYLDDGWELVRK